MRTHPRSLCVLGVALLWVSSGRLAAADFPGLEQAMSEEAFARAGLGKLTGEERAALDAWLVRYLAGERETVREVTKQELERVRQTPSAERIEARILLPFDGWSGTTVFRLDNGQIWRQRLPGRYRHAAADGRVGAEGVEVVISRNFFGFYVLEISGTGRSVGVERLR